MRGGSDSILDFLRSRQISHGRKKQSGFMRGRMTTLRDQSESSEKRPTAMAQNQIRGKTPEKVQQLVAQLPWAHNILLIQKTKDIAICVH